MQETTHGEFGGLGIEVMMEDGLVKVVAPMDDTPAAKAGIMSGDFITQIDDDAVQGLTLEQAVNKMKGPIATKTRLKIMRKGVDKPIDVSLVREIIRQGRNGLRLVGWDSGLAFDLLAAAGCSGSVEAGDTVTRDRVRATALAGSIRNSRSAKPSEAESSSRTIGTPAAASRTSRNAA